MTFIVLTAIIAILSVGIISLVLAYNSRKSLKSIRGGVMQFAEGFLDRRIKIFQSGEPGKLADALNRMAAHLGRRIDAITAQRNELEAVFSGMSEGVIVTDDHQHIISINKAGAALLNVDAQTAIGRGIAEIIYNAELQQLILDVLDKKQIIEKDIVTYKDGKRYLQLRGTSVDTANGPRAVIVLSDMTRLHQLENLRQEFVSNVSHELKTPITSIKGFVETLLDGAIDEPNESKKFLEIIAKHTDRLNAIIEDILSLSRIEQETENRNITIEIGSVKEVLTSAMNACQTKATEKEIQITIDCDPALTAPINSPLLEQALVNLIDNAIKYSDPNKTVAVTARQDIGELVISVRDEGCGIAPEHLSRIFERFYVTDKARSRKLGGTGLGLAIVKHIVIAHGGKVTVESRLVKGSTFTITLPI